MQSSTDNTSQPKAAWNVDNWLIYTLFAILIGCGIGVLPLFLWGFTEAGHRRGALASFGTAGLIIGTSIGAAQMLALCTVIPSSWRWLLATCIGWSCGFAIFGMATDYTLFRDQYSFWMNLFRMFVFSLPVLLTSILQWFVLRSSVPVSVWWIFLNLGCWLLLLPVSAFVIAQGVFIPLLVAEIIRGITMNSLFKSSPTS